MEMKEVLLREIKLADDSFSFRRQPVFSFSGEALARTGFLCPPVLRRDKKKYQIIRGKEEIVFLKKRGKKKIKSLFFPEGALPRDQAVILSFCFNLDQGPFNDLEKALALGKLRKDGKIKDRTLVEKYLPLLGLPPSEKCLREYLAVNGLPAKLLGEVSRKKINPRTVLVIAGLRGEARSLFWELIKKYGLNYNKSGIIRALLGEISLRDGKPLISLLRRELARQPSSFEELRGRLLDERYPLSRRARARFREFEKSLGLPKGIKLEHSPFFEENKLKVVLEGKSLPEIEFLANSLKQALGKENFVKIFSLLSP